MSESYCRIDGVIAREANKAVIFRRGPSAYTQMLLWDMNSDEIIPGQWIKANLRTMLCLVTPDAEYVYTHALSYSNVHGRRQQNLHHWNAVSRPPYFSAIGLWRTSFYDREIELPTQQNNLEPTQLSQQAIDLAQHAHRPHTYSQLIREGWQLLSSSEEVKKFNDWRDRSNPPETLIYRKELEDGAVLYQIDQNRKKYTITNTVTIYDRSSQEILTIQSKPNHPLWIDVDKAGRIVYADKGCLWAWANFPEGEPQLIADLNPNTFEEVAPPEWATKP